MDLQATLAGSFTFHYLEAPRYEEQPLPIGRLLGRNGFKCYRYFRCGRGPGTGGHRRSYRVPDPGNGSRLRTDKRLLDRHPLPQQGECRMHRIQ
jgi:hypothetical protein